MLENAHFKAQNSPNSIWRPGSARTHWGSLQRSPRPLDGNEIKMERKGTIRSKEKREINGKGGKLGIMKYVSRIVEICVIGNYTNLPP